MLVDWTNNHSTGFTLAAIDDEVEYLVSRRDKRVVQIFDHVHREVNHGVNVSGSVDRLFHGGQLIFEVVYACLQRADVLKNHRLDDALKSARLHFGLCYQA